MVNSKHILYVENELFQFISLFGSNGELSNVKLAFRRFKSKRMSAKEFKNHICFYSVQSFSKILNSTMEDSNQRRITKKQVYSIVDDLYHYKKYYKSNQHEYGEYNENKIFNEQ